MRNIPSVTCNIVLHPPINKIALLLLFRPVTPVTGVTSRNRCNMLRHIAPSLVFLRKILISSNPKFRILFLGLLLLCVNNMLSQNPVTRVTGTKVGGIVLKKPDSSDLPDFSNAIEMFDCENQQFNFDINNLPIVSEGAKHSVINEHLKHLPNSNLKVTQYFRFDGKVIKNSICPNWIKFEFNQFGQLPIAIVWTVDNFFVITSKDEPSCEVVIWFQGAHIPMGKGAFFNCIN
jgi:hypothetical protein